MSDDRRVGHKLYRSKRWQKVRQIYLLEHPFCERCQRMGIIVAATQVHHRIWLTEQNLQDPSIALASENLEALCDVCHAKEHHASSDVADDLMFDADGNLRRC